MHEDRPQPAVFRAADVRLSSTGPFEAQVFFVGRLKATTRSAPFGGPMSAFGPL